jgi:hypothetical protein
LPDDNTYANYNSDSASTDAYANCNNNPDSHSDCNSYIDPHGNCYRDSHC